MEEYWPGDRERSKAVRSLLSSSRDRQNQAPQSLRAAPFRHLDPS